MAEFLTLMEPDSALAILLNHLRVMHGIEQIEIQNALGRVLATPVIAPYPLPSFTRSTVDGYAVQASDTYGASESLPVYLRVIGEVLMGEAVSFSIKSGECAVIHTGGMLPESADAVVMLEYTQEARPGEVEISKAVALGENIIRIGEDVDKGQEVIPSGSVLRPVEVGGLAALGIERVAVARKPRIAILSSGDEVVPLTSALQPGQVYDVNTYLLSTLVEKSGGQPIGFGILPDQREILEQVARQALQECDVIVFTAGSSASARDLTSEVINRLGAPGVLVHGVNVKPGKPTILAICDGKAVIGLPGNPVSAFVIASLFLVPVIEKWLGVARTYPKPTFKAILDVNLASQSGREEWIPVQLRYESDGYHAQPIYGKSNLIFTLVRADGFVHIIPDATGLNAGEIVDVILL